MSAVVGLLGAVGTYAAAKQAAKIAEEKRDTARCSEHIATYEEKRVFVTAVLAGLGFSALVMGFVASVIQGAIIIPFFVTAAIILLLWLVLHDWTMDATIDQICQETITESATAP